MEGVREREGMEVGGKKSKEGATDKGEKEGRPREGGIIRALKPL